MLGVTPRAIDKRARPGNIGSAVPAEPPADLSTVGALAEPADTPENEPARDETAE